MAVDVASRRPRSSGRRALCPAAHEANEEVAVPEDRASRPVSSLQRVRDLVAQDDTAGNDSPNKEQFHKRRVHSVSSHVSRMLRHTSPGPVGSPKGKDTRNIAVSSDSDDGPAGRGSYDKKPPAKIHSVKSRQRSDDEDSSESKGGKRPSAAEVAEALRKKKKTQMAITDCLKQAMVLPAPLSP